MADRRERVFIGKPPGFSGGVIIESSHPAGITLPYEEKLDHSSFFISGQTGETFLKYTTTMTLTRGENRIVNYSNVVDYQVPVTAPKMTILGDLDVNGKFTVKSNILVVSNTNRVAIGTQNPGNKFTVSDGTHSFGIFVDGTTINLRASIIDGDVGYDFLVHKLHKLDKPKTYFPENAGEIEIAKKLTVLGTDSRFYGVLNITGSTNSSHFNYGTEEHVYIRPGKNSGKVIMDIGDVNIHNQLVVSGNMTVSGTLTADKIETGQGSFELHEMNQAVTTTSDVTFKSVTTDKNITVKTGNIVMQGSGYFMTNGMIITNGGNIYVTNGDLITNKNLRVTQKSAFGTNEIATANITVKGTDNLPYFAVFRTGGNTEQFRMVSAEGNPYTTASGYNSGSWANVIDSHNSNLILSSYEAGSTGGKIILDGRVETTGDLFLGQTNYIGFVGSSTYIQGGDGELYLGRDGSWKLHIDGAGDIKVAQDLYIGNDNVKDYFAQKSHIHPMEDITGLSLDWSAIQNKPDQSTRWPTYVEITSNPIYYGSGKFGFGLNGTPLGLGVVEIHKKGSGTQELLVLSNTQSASDNVGSSIMFRGTNSGTHMGLISTNWVTSSTFGGTYMTFKVRDTLNNIVEKIKVKHDNIDVFGDTRFNGSVNVNFITISNTTGSSILRLEQTDMNTTGGTEIHAIQFTRPHYGTTAKISTEVGDSKATDIVISTTTGGGASVLQKQVRITGTGELQARDLSTSGNLVVNGILRVHGETVHKNTVNVQGSIHLKDNDGVTHTNDTTPREIIYWDNNTITESAKIRFSQPVGRGLGNEPGIISFWTRAHDDEGGGAIQERVSVNGSRTFIYNRLEVNNGYPLVLHNGGDLGSAPDGQSWLFCNSGQVEISNPSTQGSGDNILALKQAGTYYHHFKNNGVHEGFSPNGGWHNYGRHIVGTSETPPDVSHYNEGDLYMVVD